MREVGSGTTRVDADKLAFDELLWIWHAANPVAFAPGECAACGTAFEPPVMSLPDGAQVCDKADHGCLTAYGNGRRMEAVEALKDLGITPPALVVLRLTNAMIEVVVSQIVSDCDTTRLLD